jgi:hypothetical protein
MAVACRIDDLRINDDGSISIAYTDGTGTLPVPASGRGLELPSREALKRMLDEAVDAMTIEQKIALALSPWYRSNNQLTNLAAAKGRTVTLDLSGSTAPIVIS